MRRRGGSYGYTAISMGIPRRRTAFSMAVTQQLTVGSSPGLLSVYYHASLPRRRISLAIETVVSKWNLTSLVQVVSLPGNSS